MLFIYSFIFVRGWQNHIKCFIPFFYFLSNGKIKYNLVQNSQMARGQKGFCDPQQFTRLFHNSVPFFFLSFNFLLQCNYLWWRFLVLTCWRLEMMSNMQQKQLIYGLLFLLLLLISTVSVVFYFTQIRLIPKTYIE